jgi:hypothetical protein
MGRVMDVQKVADRNKEWENPFSCKISKYKLLNYFVWNSMEYRNTNIAYINKDNLKF